MLNVWKKTQCLSENLLAGKNVRLGVGSVSCTSSDHLYGHYSTLSILFFKAQKSTQSLNKLLPSNFNTLYIPDAQSWFNVNVEM